MDGNDGDSDLGDAGAEWRRHQTNIYDLIEAYEEEHEIDPFAVSMLLIDIALDKRMLAYVFGVEKPSGTGLKLDLDRFRREFEELVRDAKKGAEDFVADTRSSAEGAIKEES